jgi:hypothetical protein
MVEIIFFSPGNNRERGRKSKKRERRQIRVEKEGRKKKER